MLDSQRQDYLKSELQMKQNGTEINCVAPVNRSALGLHLALKDEPCAYSYLFPCQSSHIARLCLVISPHQGSGN